MSIQSKSVSHLWPIMMKAAAWTLLVPGFVLMGKSSLEIIALQHVTTNALSGSTAGLLLLLIGSLVHSCRKEYRYDFDRQQTISYTD